MEFNTMSLGETLMRPTAMLVRNLMAMEVEETLRATSLDGVVLLAGCDKTIPAMVMGAARRNGPAVADVGLGAGGGCRAASDRGARRSAGRRTGPRRHRDFDVPDP
ncbi:MAG: dihydroxy-acid dehydratase [Sciscionella sp.]